MQWLINQQSNAHCLLTSQSLITVTPMLLLVGQGWLDRTLLVLVLAYIWLSHRSHRQILMQPNPNCPQYLYMLTSMGDNVCLSIATVLFQIAQPVIHLAAWIAPEPFSFYVYPGAISQQGDKVRDSHMCTFGQGQRIGGSRDTGRGACSAALACVFVPCVLFGGPAGHAEPFIKTVKEYW